MLSRNQGWRLVDESLFSLLGQGDDELKELLEDQDPKELEGIYRQRQAEDQNSLDFSDWLESQLKIAI